MRIFKFPPLPKPIMTKERTVEDIQQEIDMLYKSYLVLDQDEDNKKHKIAREAFRIHFINLYNEICKLQAKKRQ